MSSRTDQAWRDARLAAQCHTSDGKQLVINLTRCGGCRAINASGVKLLRVYREPKRVLLYFLCARCVSFYSAQDEHTGGR